jgi:hypothetical protein
MSSLMDNPASCCSLFLTKWNCFPWKSRKLWTISMLFFRYRLYVLFTILVPPFCRRDDWCIILQLQQLFQNFSSRHILVHWRILQFLFIDDEKAHTQLIERTNSRHMVVEIHVLSWDIIYHWIHTSTAINSWRYISPSSLGTDLPYKIYLHLHFFQ